MEGGGDGGRKEEEAKRAYWSMSMQTRAPVSLMRECCIWLKKNLLLALTITFAFVGGGFGFYLRSMKPSIATVEIINLPEKLYCIFRMSECCMWLKKNLLLALTITFAFVGGGCGFYLRSMKLSIATVEIINLPGELFMRMLQMTMLPLITSSIITGLATLDPKTSRRVFTLSFVYYAVTTFIAVIVGIILVLSIAPGKRVVWYDQNNGKNVPNNLSPFTAQDAFFDLLRNVFPENLAQACIEQYQTVYKREDINGTLEGPLRKTSTYTNRMNVIGIIAMSVTCGIILGKMREKGESLVNILIAVDQVTMNIISLIMWYSPIGIASLIIGKLVEVADVRETLSALGFYMITVLSGLFIQMFVIQPLIYMLLTRKNPLTFMKGLLQVWMTAFVTSSSAATLPVTIECCEQNLNIDKRIARFVLPVGATINMNGTALYEAVSAVFIAQLTVGYKLTVLKVIIIRYDSFLGVHWTKIVHHGASIFEQ
uniref:Amino acid transporter n=1 Tax=Ascaris lumbricoides TaxID=6252 RepID=A0A0M3IAZ4_ASCLU